MSRTEPVDPDEREIERCVGRTMAALFRKAQRDPKDAFRAAGSFLDVLSGFKMDLIQTRKIKYDDL
jgi:hypothetical protein